MNRILRVRDVLDRTGLSRSTLYRGMKAGRFPPSVRLGPHNVGWREADIEGWIVSRPSTRPDDPVQRIL